MNTALAKDYDLEAIERGLTALALCAGNQRAASRRLKALHGLDIPAGTLRKWRESVHVERYEKLRDQTAGRIQAAVAAEAEDLSREAMAGCMEMVERLRKEGAELPLRDVPGAARNLSVIAGVAVDKTALARERPIRTEVQIRTLDETLRALAAIDPGLVIVDGEAVEEIEEGGK